MCIYAYLLYSAEPGKPSFCIANFGARARTFHMSLWNQRIFKQPTALVEWRCLPLNKTFPEEFNFLPGVFGKHFLLAFNKTLGGE